MNGDLTGGSYVESHIFQKGSGIGSVLASIGRIALPTLKKLGGYAARKALNFAGDTANDIVSGRNISQSMRKNADALLENVKFDASRKLNMKRTTPKRTPTSKKKRRKNAPPSLW